MLVAEQHAVIASAGASPAFANKAGVGMLAGDIRLANRAELRADLHLAGDAGDAAIALEAFARWGLDFPRHLVGEFALVLFDRAAARLIAARDALGIRPLYYRDGVSHLRIASELRALIEPGDRLDEGFLAEALGGSIVDAEGTPYAAVRRVPAAHVLVAGPGGDLRLSRYWEPPCELLADSRADLAERFRATFDEAVRAACDGPERVGLHLSGGLDSSSVLGTVMTTGVRPPIVASCILPWPESDERAWIAAAANRWHITPLLIETPVGPSAHGLAAIHAHRDLPDLPSAGPMLAPINAALREAGAGAVLTGFGGDQYWLGDWIHMADLLKQGRFGGLNAWRRAGASMGDIEWSWGAFLTEGVFPLVPAGARAIARRVRPAPLPSWIDPGFAERVGLRDRLGRRPGTAMAPSENWRRMRWRLDGGEEALLKERLDRIGVAQQIELRHPLYDRRVVDLAFTIPGGAHLEGGRHRAIMRRAMADRLASETLARTTKSNLAPVLIDAARAPDLAPYLGLPRLSDLGWIDRSAAARLVDRVTARGDDESIVAFWSIVGVEAWLSMAFEAE